MNISDKRDESIQDTLDKLNALLAAMAGDDFIDLNDNIRVTYMTVIMEYMISLENLLYPVLSDDHR